MTREQLDAIRARMEAATPGPWEAWTAVCCPDCGWVDGPKRTVCPVYEGTKRTHTLDANDAEFIASAREDVPALLAEVERLQALGALLSADIQRLTRRVAENEVDWMALRAEAATAFQRGVAAMREAAVLASRENIGCRHMVCHSCESPAAVIRALPDPEYKR